MQRRPWPFALALLVALAAVLGSVPWQPAAAQPSTPQALKGERVVRTYSENGNTYTVYAEEQTTPEEQLAERKARFEEAENANSSSIPTPVGLIVTFGKESGSASLASATLANFETEPTQQPNTVSVIVPTDELTSTFELLQASPDVTFVEPMYRRSVRGSLDNEWYVTQVEANTARQSGYTGAGIVVAVIDTGVDLNHSELTDNLVSAGKDFVNDDNSAQDDEGHGTHVAGIAQAIGPAIKVLPVKVLDSNGSGYDTDVADGIRWAADNGAKVINLSLGGPGANSYLCSAVKYALDKGILVAVAAGNDSNTAVGYPALCDPRTVIVSATTRTQSLASYSNYGVDIDIAAPGGDGVIGQNETRMRSSWPGGGYEYLRGTSMAAPVIAGAAAVLMGANPSWSGDQIGQRLVSTATDIGQVGRDDSFGAGEVSLAAALNLPTAPVISNISANPSILQSQGGSVNIQAFVGDRESVVGMQVEFKLGGDPYKPMSRTTERIWSANANLPNNGTNQAKEYALQIKATDNSGKVSITAGPTIYVLPPTGASSTVWPVANGDNSRRTVGYEKINPAQSTKGWGVRALGSAGTGGCVATSDTLFCGDSVRIVSTGADCKQGPYGGGTFVATDIATGATKWELSCANNDNVGMFTGSRAPVIHQGLVYFADNYGFLHAATLGGQLLWRKQVGNHVPADLLVSNNLVYVGTDYSGLAAVDPQNGEVRWRYAPAGYNITNGAGMAIGSSRIVIPFSRSGGNSRLQVLDLTGNPTWGVNIATSLLSNTPMINDGVVYFSYEANYQRNIYEARRLSDGTSLWSTSLSVRTDGNGWAISPDGSTVYTGGTGCGEDEYDYTTCVVAFDAKTGAVKWQKQTDTYGTQWATPIAIGDAVFAGTYFAKLVGFDKTGAEVYREELNDVQNVRTELTWDGKSLYVVTGNGYIWQRSFANNGKYPPLPDTELPPPPPPPSGEFDLGPDIALCLADSGKFEQLTSWKMNNADRGEFEFRLGMSFVDSHTVFGSGVGSFLQSSFTKQLALQPGKTYTLNAVMTIEREGASPVVLDDTRTITTRSDAECPPPGGFKLHLPLLRR